MRESLVDNIVGGLVVLILAAIFGFALKQLKARKISLKYLTNKMLLWRRALLSEENRKKMRYNSSDFFIPIDKYHEVEQIMLLINSNMKTQDFKKFMPSQRGNLRKMLSRAGIKTKESPRGLTIVGTRRYAIGEIGHFKSSPSKNFKTIPVHLLIWINLIIGKGQNRIEFYRHMRKSGIQIVGIVGEATYILDNSNLYSSHYARRYTSSFMPQTLRDYKELFKDEV